MSYLDVMVACLSKNKILRFWNKNTECSHLWQNWGWTSHSLIACGCHIFIYKTLVKLPTAFVSESFTLFQNTSEWSHLYEVAELSQLLTGTRFYPYAKTHAFKGRNWKSWTLDQKCFSVCSGKQCLNASVTERNWFFFFFLLLLPPIIIPGSLSCCIWQNFVCPFSLFPYLQPLSFCFMVWLLHRAMQKESILICYCLNT